jgi:SAM-dependent methyltransferase
VDFLNGRPFHAGCMLRPGYLHRHRQTYAGLQRYDSHMSEHVDALDDPATTAARRDRLRGDSYLRRLYAHWYQLIVRELPPGSGEVLELGSGGGFLDEFIPGLRTSDVMQVPGVELVVDARSLPFADGSLRAIVGTNVLHHIPNIERFFGEAQRSLIDGGRLIFIEPWPTPLSKPIYKHFHHEPFDQRGDWSIPHGGPLTAANGALPWIILHRDRVAFEHRFPALRVLNCKPFMPLSYLISGGIARSWPLPPALFNVVEWSERSLAALGLFSVIVLQRGTRT